MSCKNCGGSLGALLFFCRTCWPKIPAKDRISLQNMYVRRLDTSSKIEKILRGLREKRAQEGTVLVVVEPHTEQRAGEPAVKISYGT